MSERRIIFGKRAFSTKFKTTTKLGKREYMRQYMKSYRDLTRKHEYVPRKWKPKNEI